MVKNGALKTHSVGSILWHKVSSVDHNSQHAKGSCSRDYSFIVGGTDTGVITTRFWQSGGQLVPGMLVFIHVKWRVLEIVNFRARPSLMTAALANWTSLPPCTGFCKDSQIVWGTHKTKGWISGLLDNLAPSLMSRNLAILAIHIGSRLQCSQKWNSSLVFFSRRKSHVVWLNYNTLWIAESVCQLFQKVAQTTHCNRIWLCKPNKVGCLLCNKLVRQSTIPGGTMTIWV